MRTVRKSETGRVGKRGAIDIPTSLEIYSDQRVAEFTLSNAVDADDYAEAVKQVKAMGLDPELIPHVKPE